MARLLTRERNERTTGTLFILEAPFAKTVTVTGSFNQWNPKEHPLRRDRNGSWSARLFLKPGTYEYKFVVDGVWQEDPQADNYTQNPFGTRNSIITVR